MDGLRDVETLEEEREGGREDLGSGESNDSVKYIPDDGRPGRLGASHGSLYMAIISSVASIASILEIDEPTMSCSCRLRNVWKAEESSTSRSFRYP